MRLHHESVRTIRRAAALALGALCLAACGGSPAPGKAAPPPPPPVDDDLLALAPAAYSQVARVDVAGLRASPLWGATDLAMIDPTFSRLRSLGGGDPLLEADEILATGGDPGGTGTAELLVLIKGRLDAKATAAAMDAQGSGGDAGPEGAGDIRAEALTGRTLAVGTPRIVGEAAALARREGRSLLDEAAFADLALGADARIVYRFRRGAEELPLDRVRLAPLGSLRWGRRATAVDGAVRIGDGLNAELLFSLDDPKAAARARRDLKRSFSRLSGNAVMRLLGIGRLFTRVAVAGEGERVEVRLALTAEDVAEVRKLFERVAQIRELMTADEDVGEDVGLDPPMLERGGRP